MEQRIVALITFYLFQTFFFFFHWIARKKWDTLYKCRACTIKKVEEEAKKLIKVIPYIEICVMKN